MTDTRRDDMLALVPGVKKHALEHWEEDGWDFCVEAMDTNEVLEILLDPIDGETVVDLADAIKVVGRVCKLLDERRKDVQATAW